MSEINRIRKGKKIEPENSGVNHPTTAYVILGHGEEKLSNKRNRSIRRVVPKGCILVVKAHSGDTVYSAHSFVPNVIATLQKENRNIILDPVAHKVELYDMFTEEKYNMNNHSVAIYREGDSYPDFWYSPVSYFPKIKRIVQSGILRFKTNTPEHTDLIADYQRGIFEYPYSDTTAFILENGKYIYNTTLIDIPSYFKYSNLNEYYCTEDHIKDIIECIAEFEAGSDRSSTSKFKKADQNNNLLDSIDKKAFLKFDTEKYKEYESLPNTKTKDEYITAIVKTFTVNDVLYIISEVVKISQYQLFELVRKGYIPPGVFYNLVCRASDETDPYTDMLRRSAGVSVTRVSQGIRNRISEAVLQRKNQIRKVMNTRRKNVINKFTRNIKEAYNRRIRNSLISKNKNLQLT